MLRPLSLRTVLPAVFFLILPGASLAQSGDRAPSVTAPSSVTVKHGLSVSFVVTASDPDGNAIVSLTASGSALDAGASFDVSAANTMGTLNWTPAWEGVFIATFTAANALLGTANTTVRVISDHAPTVTAPMTLAGVTYSELSFTVSASDPDGDPLTLFAAGLPSGAQLTIDSSGPEPAAHFVWTPGPDQEGTHSIRFTALASNGSAGSARTEVVITERQQPIGSPYMFLDTNGDGAFDELDKMNPNGVPTTVDVWVSTLGTRTGASTVCNTLDGSLGTWSSYVANIGVVGGTVTFGAPTNQQVTFTTAAVPFQATDTEMTYGQAGPSSPAGFHRMFTIEVTGVSGQPSLVFLPLGHLGTEPTSFGTPCSGLDHDNAYKLGRDWYEAIGALPSTGPSGPNIVRNPSFETSTVGWKGLDGGTIRRVEGGHDGSYSLAVEGPADSTGKFSVNDSPNWVARAPAAGTVYRLAAWVRSAGTAGKARLRVRQYLNRVHQSILWSAPVMLGPAWQKVTLDVTAVAAGVTLDLQVMDTPVAPAEIFQTDDISIWTLFQPAGIPGSRAASAMDAVVSPNPLNPDAVLSFTTHESGPALVRIYDVTGRLVRTLSEPALAPGRQALHVDGKDGSGRHLASGVYFFRIEAGPTTATGRFAIVR